MSSPDNHPQKSRADLIALVVAIVLPSLITWAYFFKAESAEAGVQQAVFAVAKVFQFALPAVWVFLIQRKRFEWFARSKAGLGIGLAFGVVVAVAGLALFHFVLRDAPFFAPAAEQIRAKVAGMGMNTPLKYVCLGLFYTVFHSLLEEYYWRWFVFQKLKNWVSVNSAIVISSLGFMAHHVLVLGKFFGFAHWATWVFSLAVATGGLAWAWLYQRSDSLLGPWLSHAVVDAGIFLIGYQLVANLLVG
ncbi:CPBP family intramembrane glutamic endopeptidase [Adhaeretor mobilis]|uniref:CAAX amino terminal protease self-immunity n=1 Tax=Adhaeretor mobilis TaxID=1930276 RepID=A0A517MUH4_9BACT|nr:type II CAAX endopeptidase family protein [Adhaeretor mobilis]QDS98530.1 CAAX amino terminal protease self- immunity [Adhaeretor mobilis]